MNVHMGAGPSARARVRGVVHPPLKRACAVPAAPRLVIELRPSCGSAAGIAPWRECSGAVEANQCAAGSSWGAAPGRRKKLSSRSSAQTKSPRAGRRFRRDWPAPAASFAAPATIAPPHSELPQRAFAAEPRLDFLHGARRKDLVAGAAAPHNGRPLRLSAVQSCESECMQVVGSLLSIHHRRRGKNGCTHPKRQRFETCSTFICARPSPTNTVRRLVSLFVYLTAFAALLFALRHFDPPAWHTWRVAGQRGLLAA